MPDRDTIYICVLHDPATCENKVETETRAVCKAGTGNTNRICSYLRVYKLFEED